MYEGAFFAQGHPAPQGCSESDHLGYEGLWCQVLFEDHPSQDGLHFWDAGPDSLGGHDVNEAGAEEH